MSITIAEARQIALAAHERTEAGLREDRAEESRRSAAHMNDREKLTRDVLEAMRPRERDSIEFLERVAIIEEGCHVTMIEAYMMARRQGQR